MTSLSLSDWQRKSAKESQDARKEKNESELRLLEDEIFENSTIRSALDQLLFEDTGFSTGAIQNSRNERAKLFFMDIKAFGAQKGTDFPLSELDSLDVFLEQTAFSSISDVSDRNRVRAYRDLLKNSWLLIPKIIEEILKMIPKNTKVKTSFWFHVPLETPSWLLVLISTAISLNVMKDKGVILVLSDQEPEWRKKIASGNIESQKQLGVFTFMRDVRKN